MSARALPAANLRAIAPQLLDEPPGAIFATGPSRGPTTRRVRDAGDPDDLIGFTADPSWRAIALLFAGAATHLDTGDRDRALVCLALNRSGASHAALRIDADGPMSLPLDGGYGFLVDVAKRTVGAPTAPVTDGSETLAMSRWLTVLLDRVADRATPRRRFGDGRTQRRCTRSWTGGQVRSPHPTSSRR